MTGQQNEEFVEPTPEEIVQITKQHVAAMEATDDDAAWIHAGMNHVVLHTIGRKSGNEHKVALPFWMDDQGRRVVVGSWAGSATHPHWYLNLADRTANPEVRIRVQGAVLWADAEILDGDEYDRTWAALTADRAYYNDYQSRTERRLPLIRFHEKRPA